jgi:copper resistance protein B
MRRLLILLAATAATPASAQHDAHAQHGGHAAPPAQPDPHAGHVQPSAPAPGCTAEHAAMGHCTMAAPAPAPTPAPPASCPPEHAAMGHCKPAAETQPDPHAGHAMPAQSPAAQGDPHAGHGMSHAAPLPPKTPPPAAAFSGPEHAQDLVYDPRVAARSRAGMIREHGGMRASKFLIDQLEVGFREGHESYAWDGQFWHGGDIDKLWIKTEGEGGFGEGLESAEVQALWSHALDPWFDLQVGVRQDFRPGPQRTHLVLGAQGLAPYWFEIDGALFLSDEGEVTGRFEAEYDLRLTQQLILQPLAEFDFSFQDIPELGIGAGVSTAEIGARLRYEIFPRSGLAVIAPYVGVEYERAFGDTASFRRKAGEEVGGWSLLVGVRTWF